MFHTRTKGRGIFVIVYYKTRSLRQKPKAFFSSVPSPPRHSPPAMDGADGIRSRKRSPSPLVIEKSSGSEGKLTEDAGQPLSPGARLFHQPNFNCYILATVGCGKRIDVDVVKTGLEATLLRHPRFSSLRTVMSRFFIFYEFRAAICAQKFRASILLAAVGNRISQLLGWATIPFIYWILLGAVSRRERKRLPTDADLDISSRLEVALL
ncbi:hypothetical protein ACLOJK_010247 [Asimina triloba]